MFDFLELGLQSINLGDYTPHPGDLRVGILHHVTCTIVARLDGVFCGILQLSAGPVSIGTAVRTGWMDLQRLCDSGSFLSSRQNVR